jgi:hypothetical protein
LDTARKQEGGSVTGSWSKSATEGHDATSAINTSVAHPARVYDYWLGGKDNARALLTSTPQGATAYIDADAREPEKIKQAAAQTLDFGQPIAVITLMIMRYIPDSDDPRGIVARLLAGLAPGSYLVSSDTGKDIDAETVANATGRLNQRMGAHLTSRTKAQIAGYFSGLEMVEPGLVPLNRWRPGPDDPILQADLPTYCGIGRKP